MFGLVRYDLEISIHASAREATALCALPGSLFHDFNPRLREGGDMSKLLGKGTFDKFQSTPPRGRRLKGTGKAGFKRAFQSTPPRGRRRYAWNYCRDARFISIHASAREATLLTFSASASSLRFQSTPPRGRRRYKYGFSTATRVFQSTPPRGRRQTWRVCKLLTTGISIHASAREATKAGRGA